MKTCIKIHPKDQVAVALAPLTAGAVVQVGDQAVTLRENIPQGHKFALAAIREGSSLIKYGAPIGIAAADIPQGSWVHTHNLKTGLCGVPDYTYEPDNAPLVPTDDCLFQGYRREDGRAAVRNEIWIIPTVSCVNSVARAVERRAQSFKSGTVGGVFAFPHPYSCSQMGDNQENTRKVLAGLIHHPNAGGVLVLGLGCEDSGIDALMPYIGRWNEKRVKFLVCQESEDEIGDALALIQELAGYAGSFRREPISCSELVIGMMCSGPDGLSGVTADPTVGAFSDLLISKGGTTLLTGVPEMFGAETLLMDRCENERIFADTVHLVNSFKQYFTIRNKMIYGNLSPGSEESGISTPEERALGCARKSGSAPVTGVLSYGERVKRPGLHLLGVPGSGLAAATALAASGAHIVLFTTGRGAPFASPVPIVEISNNSALAERKKNWIDFSCGAIAEDVAEMGQKLFDHVLETASGREVRAEQAGFHDMAVFEQGVTL